MTIDNANNPALNINNALDHFINCWLSLHQTSEHKDSLSIEYDSLWQSDCYQSALPLNDGDDCFWQPVKQTDHSQDMFDRLSDALGFDIHPDITAFYSRYWSSHLSASNLDGDLELLQIWNQDDMERLRSNLLGHAIDKQKRKQDISFFFAVTSPEDGMLCVNNQNGEVWFELAGKKPIRKIADSLPLFIQSLTPTLLNQQS